MPYNPTNRCVAHRKNGDRCKKAAIRGGTVCRSHGGAAPQVQRSARERWLDGIDPMINTTMKHLQDAVEGKLTPMEALAWAKFFADRAGFVPGKTVNIEGEAKWEIAMTQIIREIPAELAAGEVVDADVIEDEEDLLAQHDREEAEKRRQAWEESARDRAREELPNFMRHAEQRPRMRTELPRHIGKV